MRTPCAAVRRRRGEPRQPTRGGRGEGPNQQYAHTARRQQRPGEGDLKKVVRSHRVELAVEGRRGNPIPAVCDHHERKTGRRGRRTERWKGD